MLISDVRGSNPSLVSMIDVSDYYLSLSWVLHAFFLCTVCWKVHLELYDAFLFDFSIKSTRTSVFFPCFIALVHLSVLKKNSRYYSNNCYLCFCFINRVHSWPVCLRERETGTETKVGIQDVRHWWEWLYLQRRNAEYAAGELPLYMEHHFCHSVVAGLNGKTTTDSKLL